MADHQAQVVTVLGMARNPDILEQLLLGYPLAGMAGEHGPHAYSLGVDACTRFVAGGRFDASKPNRDLLDEGTLWLLVSTPTAPVNTWRRAWLSAAASGHCTDN